ncbi:hypothetical protein CABS01_16859 [Colletotrichum abscissum]|uniref:uncharacterized protein n=1 Tax=Colletotrichum abscissum TaxID=1671311 RepID=UPI0027D726F1|nr:uncharacterized protein CABS01_16859 [Colletotrichum abscissum]KAK1509289.1 hypothetical protein CABS01_16859 [Colletotrichum abscissum]
MSGSNSDNVDEPLRVVTPPRDLPSAHQGPAAELSLPGQEDVEAADGDAENSIEFEALISGRDKGDDEVNSGGESSEELSPVPPSESEGEDENVSDIEPSEKESKKRKASSSQKGGKKQKRTPRGQGTPRVPKKLKGVAPEERLVQCMPCLRAALRYTDPEDGGRCLVGSGGRCARCFNGRSAEGCVDVPVVLRPMAWALTEAIVNGAPSLDIAKLRGVVHWMDDNTKMYENHIGFYAEDFLPARPPPPPPSAPVLSVAPVVVVYDQPPVAAPAPAPQVIDLTVVPPPAPPAAPAAPGFVDFEARKARFLARVPTLLASDAMIPAIAYFVDQEFK